MNIKTTINPTLKDIPADYSTLRFGYKFTDHMLIMPYRDGQFQTLDYLRVLQECVLTIQRYC